MSDSESALNEIRDLVMRYCGPRLDERFDPDNPLVRLHEPTFGGEEVWAALETLISTRVTMGPKVRELEEAYAEMFGYREAIMVNSGSSANLLAVAALVNPECHDGLRPGDEVIVPALSWSTTVWPLVQFGLVPVIVDIDPVTLNIDPQAIEEAISPKTRGLMPVHVYGNPCDMGALAAIADRYGLTVIEDSCESMGAYYDGKPVGGIGRVGTFSTYFSHHITTLEGGFCVTDDFEFAELMRVLRAHGWVREMKKPEAYLRRYPDIDRKFLFVNSGFNLRATELQAAIGLKQLPKLQEFIDARAANSAFFRQRLNRYDNYLLLQDVTPRATSSWFGLPITVRPGAPFTAQEMCAHLNTDGIETRPIIAGNMAAQPAMQLFEHRVHGDLTNANLVMTNGFTFGNHQSLDEAARLHVAASIDAFMSTLAG